MNMSRVKTNVLIIGAGVIGISIADVLLRNNIKDVTILEKNSMIMQETSSHNSGLIHGGFDAKPGTLKAKFNYEGRKMFEKRFFIPDKKEFRYSPIKSFILAYNEREVKELSRLFSQGIENGLDKNEMEIISGDKLREIDKYISPKVIKALVCYSSWVIDPLDFGKYMHNNLNEFNLNTITSFEVDSIEQQDSIIVKSKDGQEIEANFIINASGVWAEKIARMVEDEPEFEIESKRGQYIILDKTQAKKMEFNVYFLTPSRNGKGVIVAPQFDGRVLVGPNAEDGVPLTDGQMVTRNGLSFVQKIGSKINPSLNMERIETVMAGSRPINLKGNDYHIKMSNSNINMLHVAGTQSPALSGCLAIAKYVYKLYLKQLNN